eukprot:CAMPEP_0170135038 /NCGR_PEP_ID=MMETSP0033_2-20121228/2270_1 /TAXON_ID=195969 /ORGANISM="Dolichomastix tenuilepis, Strain CCMP3274" /LENGTH=258 /DNA_ID=CAMNT_0010370631 /DNA_START=48 /DNA_END=827 /DNA_ORIENTATION=+
MERGSFTTLVCTGGAVALSAALVWTLRGRVTVVAESVGPFEPRPYHPSDSVSSTRQITATFATDPVARFLLTDDARYHAASPAVYTGMLWALGASYEMTDVLCDERGEVVSTAIWEEAEMTVGGALRMAAVLVTVLSVTGVRDTLRFGRMMLALEAKRHQHAPTALHLQLFGTDPAMQGKRLGSKLIRVGIDRAERRGVPCYLESSNPRNVPFYLRHGFVEIEKVYPFAGAADGNGRKPVEGDGPVMTLMIRKPGEGR